MGWCFLGFLWGFVGVLFFLVLLFVYLSAKFNTRFWPKILLFLLPHLPSQTNLEFCWLRQLDKETGSEVGFLWQGLFVHKNISSLAFCCAAGSTQWELVSSSNLVAVNTLLRETLSLGSHLLGHLHCSSVLPPLPASGCCHVFYPHCLVPICMFNKVSLAIPAHACSTMVTVSSSFCRSN